MNGSHVAVTEPSPPLDPLLDPPLLELKLGGASVAASTVSPPKVLWLPSSPHATTSATPAPTTIEDKTKPNPFSMTADRCTLDASGIRIRARRSSTVSRI